MSDVKNIVTMGIGASPGSLFWFITSGLEGGAPIVPPPTTGGSPFASPRYLLQPITEDEDEFIILSTIAGIL